MSEVSSRRPGSLKLAAHGEGFTPAEVGLTHGAQSLKRAAMILFNGAEALAILQARGDPVQLVMSDIVMPRMGGRALHEALRREGSNVRFLFTSGYGG